MALAALAMVAALVIALGWRNAWAPAVGAAAGVVIALAAGVARVDDIAGAADDLWRPLITIISIMTMTACAAELGLFARLAAWIEPRTRGPVKHAFRVTYVLAALTAALLSNDAAILLLTPLLVELLCTVYPRRHPKFVLPFAFAAFVAAGVAPLPTGNPINLVVASRTHINVNEYALRMIPVAIVAWLVSYAMLARCFREALADEAPALGKAPPIVPLSAEAIVVLVVTGASVACYPICAVLSLPIWPISATTCAICIAMVARRSVPPLRVARAVSWELVPFLFGVLVLAIALSRAGLTGHLSALYDATPLPVATVGAVSAAGSALIDNHPMALLHSIALQHAPHRLVFAALIGGDLGPRILPVGSLAGLLWTSMLRQRGFPVSLGTFVRVGLLVTIPAIAASLAMLWLVC